MQTYTIDRHGHRRLRQLVHTSKREHGGFASIDHMKRTFTPVISNRTGTSTYNSVEFDRSIINFHIHPGTCLEYNTCAMGTPSPSDMKGILIGSRMGSIVHLVYALEGTYKVRLRKWLFKAVTTDKSFALWYTGFVYKAFDALYNAFDHAPVSHGAYDTFRKSFGTLAKKLGFDITLIHGDRQVTVRLKTR